MIAEIKTDFLQDLQLEDSFSTTALSLLEAGESRYLKDLRVNFKNALASDHLSEKEIYLLAIALAANEKNSQLLNFFAQEASRREASEEEIAEAVACASLLASNNVLYRFRHFTGKEKYQQLPARIKMNIMMKPVLGREFFELISLAVSAVNGCEMCVNAHENSLLELGSSEERIFDSVRLAAVITSLGKIVH